MNGHDALAVFLTALLGGSGIVGLLFWAIKRTIERRDERRKAEAERMEDTRSKITTLLEHNQRVDATLQAMAEENTLQCYCLLAALRGLEEQGCDGPVKDGINRLEKHLNKRAHEVVA